MRKIEKCRRCEHIAYLHRLIDTPPRYSLTIFKTEAKRRWSQGVTLKWIADVELLIEDNVAKPCTCDMTYKPYRVGTRSVIDEDIEEYKRRYVDYMVAQSLVSREEAEENFEAGYESLDMNDSPEDAAACEMSYWDD